MTQNSNEPVRELPMHIDDNGQPHWRSIPSHKNCKVRGACDVPLQLPGLIIFVHGVNSTGEWYADAEKSLCKGLNERLGLTGTAYQLVHGVYSADTFKDEKMEGASTPLAWRELKNGNTVNSPVIRFYWGYASSAGEEDKYVIPLANKMGEDYHKMKRLAVSAADLAKIKAKGPYIWGGGPFQNGTNNLHSLWSEKGFDENIAHIPGLKTQSLNRDKDRLLTNAPPRKYYAHAAKRLADLLDKIREKYPNDTVSIISHSQGTMIASAATALAKKGPDALFLMNSPYTMDNNKLNKYAFPESECISASGRASTLSAIIDKVAAQANRLSAADYESLCVGKSWMNENWHPDALLPHGAKERDNHGRTWIYFNPHDRVMGSDPLLSIGWQGFPNDKTGKTHPLLIKHKGHLFQRMLARSTPCGVDPDEKTPFGILPDKKPFWDDAGDKNENGMIYSDPPKWQTVFINGERVPDPIRADELATFDLTRVRKEDNPNVEKDGWGELRPDRIEKNDNTYDNFIEIYPNVEKVVTSVTPSGKTYPAANVKYRPGTFEDKDKLWKNYVAQPTDHSTLPGSLAFMSRVVAYDLPIGHCETSWDRAFLADLRDFADWTHGYDNYFKTGKVESVAEPAMISRETETEEIVMKKLPLYGL